MLIQLSQTKGYKFMLALSEKTNRALALTDSLDNTFNYKLNLLNQHDINVDLSPSAFFKLQTLLSTLYSLKAIYANSGIVLNNAKFVDESLLKYNTYINKQKKLGFNY